MGIEIPESHGGAGGSFFDSILAIEALAMVDPSVSVMVMQNTLVINAFIVWATEEQKRPTTHDSPKERSGPTPSVRLRVAQMPLHSRLGLKNVVTITSLTQQTLITNAKEDVFIVMATVDPSAGYRGITSFIVEKDFPGFKVGKKEDKLGIRASSTCELIFEDCIVPEANVLGDVGKGYKVAIETLNEGRIGIGAQMVGLAQGAFNHAMAYTKERKQFGKRICDFQGVQFQLVDLATDIECARLLVYNAAPCDAGQPFLKEAAM